MEDQLDLDKMSKEELISMVKAHSRLFLALDGFWFLTVEEAYGYDVALKVDLDVWMKYCPYEAKYLRKQLGLSKEGIPGIVEVMKNVAFAPCMSKVIINEATDERGDIGYYGCPSLMAMEKAGRTQFTCNEGECIFDNFAKTLDPNVKCKMIGGPPRKSPEDVSCRWEFTKEASTE